MSMRVMILVIALMIGSVVSLAFVQNTGASAQADTLQAHLPA
jgi:hypothetical protein